MTGGSGIRGSGIGVLEYQAQSPAAVLVFKFFIGGGDLIASEALEIDRNTLEVVQLDRTRMYCIWQ